MGIGRVNLGRAWGPYSRVIFHGTYLSPIVSPEGWNAWDYTGQEWGFTFLIFNYSITKKRLLSFTRMVSPKTHKTNNLNLWSEKKVWNFLFYFK